MKKTIWKFPLQVTDIQTIKLPAYYELLTIQAQGEEVCLWALVNPQEESRHSCTIEIFGTGNPVHYDMGVERKYISTFQLLGGKFVGHAFERIN